MQKNLQDFLDGYEKENPYRDIKVLFFGGDFFDSLLTMASDDFPWVLSAITTVLRFCDRNNVILRILEGTRRHDWEQSKNFQIIYDLIDCKADFKYVKSLSIEYIKELNAHVLYVPDEWRLTAKVTQDEVVQLLADHGLKQVDIAIMHGMFHYQLGNIPSNPKVHDELFYLSIVKGFISIGHIHTYSQFDHIVAQGSFDRISQGEEGPKGGVLWEKMPDGTWRHSFIENRNAKVFKSIKMTSEDIDICLKEIELMAHSLPIDSELRIVAKKGHPIFQAIDMLRKSIPMITFSSNELEDKKENKKSVEENADYTPIILSRETITKALHEAVSMKNNISAEQSAHLYELLEAIHGTC